MGTNNKPFILICDGMSKHWFAQLQAIKEFDVHPSPKNDASTISELASKADALVIRSATTCNEAFLKNCPNLKYIIRAGEGTDNIDKDFCRNKSILVSNTPGANNASAAEHAIALMFTLLRHTAQANQEMHSGVWNKGAHTGMEMTKKTLGIVGMGRIGQMVAEKLQGFQVKVVYFDPHMPQVRKKEFYKHYGYQALDSIDDVLKMSDIVTIHVPKSPSTENMITMEQFKHMKKNAILINAARGKIVNEDDLLNALEQKIIAGAALDVFATEPLPQNSVLLNSHDNLILTPHLGASTAEAQERVGEMVVHQLKSFFIQGQHINAVKS